MKAPHKVEATGELGEYAATAYNSHSRTIITHRGKAVAAIMPIEDFEFIEAVEEQENREDREAIRRHLAQKAEKA